MSPQMLSSHFNANTRIHSANDAKGIIETNNELKAKKKKTERKKDIGNSQHLSRKPT